MADNSRNGSNQPGSSGSYNCPTCGRDYCYSCNLDVTTHYGGPSNATIDSSASTATFSWPALSGIEMDPRSVAPRNPPPPRTQPQTIVAPRNPRPPRNPPQLSSSLHRSIPPQVINASKAYIQPLFGDQQISSSSTRGAATPSMSLPRGLAPVPDPTTPQLPSSSRPAYLPAGGSIAGPSQHVPKYACTTCGSALEGLGVDDTCYFCKPYLPSSCRVGNHNFMGIAGKGRGSIASSAGPSSTNPWPNVEPNRYRYCCNCQRILSGLGCVRCPRCSILNWM